MEAEHCSKAGCDMPFTTRNYGITTTARAERSVVVRGEAAAAAAAAATVTVIVIHQPSPIQPPYPFTAPSRWACSSGATAHRPPVKKCNTLRRYARACGMVILMEKEGAARE